MGFREDAAKRAAEEHKLQERTGKGTFERVAQAFDVKGVVNHYVDTSKVEYVDEAHIEMITDYTRKPYSNFLIQSQNAQTMIADAEAKLIADGFTKTGPDEFIKTVKNPFEFPSARGQGSNWNEAIQKMVASETLITESVPCKSFADVRPNPNPTEKALGFLLHLDEPTELFVGYQNSMNYVLLAGPYDNAFIAKGRYAEIWKQFDADKSLDIIFPHDKRDIKLLTFFDVPAATKRKGAYGKV